MVGLSLASFSAAILMVALAGWRDLRTGEAELATTTDQAIAKLAKILERPLWDLDMERVGSIAEAFSQDPRVTRLTIREASGGKLHVMTRGDSSDAIFRTARVTHQGHELGQVTIAMSRESLRAQVRQQVMGGVFVTFVALCVAFASVGLLLRQLLRRPLRELTRTAGEYAAGRYGSAPVVAREIEFEPLYQALFGMGAKIQDQLGELRRHRDHLEDEVRARTDELSTRNRELQEAVQSAEAANRAKSAFLSNMSHELRTPLNAILGFANIMGLDPRATAEQRERLAIILRSGEHLLSLINDVLDLAKIEAGKVELEPTDFAPMALLQDLVQLYQLRADEKGIRLDLERRGPLPPVVRTDAAKLRQVLTNLIGNAIKFTSQGAIIVHVGLADSVMPPRLVLDVDDTGPGIAEADFERIFQPFEQVGQQRFVQGSGLGLSITRQHLQMLGGTIRVRSELGRGSSFHVEIPVEIPAGEAAVPVPVAVPPRIVALAPGQPEWRVLVVDDEQEGLLLMRALLEGVGFRVALVSTGEAAVEQFSAWKPHFIWMDWRLPGIDGSEATRRIRALPGGAEVHIVGLTASAFRSQRDELIAAGMEDVVRKPFRSAEIFEPMARLLGARFRTEASGEHSVSGDTLSAAGFSVVPLPLRDELRAALESLDGDRIAAAVEQVARAVPPLARTLRRSVGGFAYQPILAALEEARGAGGKEREGGG
jgi:signal transduction histidine kinase/CheY-like chemotaxis protein